MTVERIASSFRRREPGAGLAHHLEHIDTQQYLGSDLDGVK